MGCLGGRKVADPRAEQKWDYISLNDFKSTSCFAPFAYGYLWLSIIISTAVYAVDTFTAVSLLVFDTWPSEIQPKVDRNVAKWVFSICIILSFLNLGYEHIRAQRIIRRGNVAECYLDNLAVRMESLRLGKGKGWKRFLVFAELTKSKKGAEYIALFTYFSFQSWIRVIICSGPRQAINALTLYSVYTVRIAASGDNVGGALADFFDKIKALAVQDYKFSLILGGMVFTLVIWVFSFLFLVMGVLFFLFFLWSYIPKSDGGLSGFCSRKINKRLTKIVTQKVNKALAKEEQRRQKAELKAARKAGENPPMELKATLPDVGGEDKLPEMPMLHRSDTMATLPAYTSRPGSPGSIELGQFDQKRPGIPSRTGTMASTNSNFSTRAPLLGHAAELGYNRSGSPAPSLPSMPDLNHYPPARPGTAASTRSFGAPSQLSRMNTNGSNFGQGYTASPSTYSSEAMPSMPHPIRSPTGPYGRPSLPNMKQQGGQPASSSRPTHDSYSSNGRASPAPSTHSYRNGPGALSPMRSATNPVPPRGAGPQYPPQRNMTAPIQRQQAPNDNYEYFDRPPTSSSQRGGNRPGFGNGWNTDVEAQRGGPRY